MFQEDGTFVKEAVIAGRALAAGSVWDLAFSRDEEQRYLFVLDGMNGKVYVVLRETLEVLTCTPPKPGKGSASTTPSGASPEHQARWTGKGAY